MLLLTSCSEYMNDESKLEYALEFAGDNRNELERVISHYDDEPEKQVPQNFLSEICLGGIVTQDGNWIL